MFTKLVVILGLCTAGVFTQAGETPLKGESEASAIIVNGNLNSQTIGAKTKNVWSFTDMDSATVFGTYIDGKAEALDKTTGKVIDALTHSWNLGGRYERAITKDQFSVFGQYMVEADPYNGVFDQRNSIDLGAKYYFVKSDDLTWFAELGFRHSDIYQGFHNVNSVSTKENYSADYVRAYTEASHKLNSSVSGKLWFEYLADVKNTDQSLWNAEASLSVVLSSMFSLKTAYLNKHNEGTQSPAKKDTSTWTTALVASY